MGSFMGGRGTANLLTRITAVLATIFMVLSLVLALLNRGTVVGPSLLDGPAESAPAPAASAPIIPPPGSAAPAPAAAPQTPVTPAPAPAPSVPTKD
jgi:preprotein translocase subunit SecG